MRVVIRLGYDGELVVYEVPGSTKGGEIKDRLHEKKVTNMPREKMELFFRDKPISDLKQMSSVKDSWHEHIPMYDWDTWKELEVNDGMFMKSMMRFEHDETHYEKFQAAHIVHEQQTEVSTLHLVLNYDGPCDHWAKQDYVRKLNPMGPCGYHQPWLGERLMDIRGPNDDKLQSVSGEIDWICTSLLIPNNIYTVYYWTKSKENFEPKSTSYILCGAYCAPTESLKDTELVFKRTEEGKVIDTKTKTVKWGIRIDCRKVIEDTIYKVFDIIQCRYKGFDIVMETELKSDRQAAQLQPGDVLKFSTKEKKHPFASLKRPAVDELPRPSKQ